MTMYDLFVEAISKKKLVKIAFMTEKKGIIERICVPLDFGPFVKFKDDRDRYQFFDISSPSGAHYLTVIPEKLIGMKILRKVFDPADYEEWRPPIGWFVKRDW